jgi:hypothetical protein
LATIKEDDDKAFEPLNELCPFLSNIKIPTPKRVEAVCILMRNRKFHTQARNYFFEILNDTDLKCEYRYKTITSLKNIFDQRKCWIKDKVEREIIDKDRIFFEKESFLYFLRNTKNEQNYRILSAQALLVNYNEIDIKEILYYLLEIAQKETNDYNTRADATDVILRYSSNHGEINNIAKKIITELGRNGQKDVKTIYQNAQNSHTKEIEESAIKTLESLSQIPLIKINNDKEVIHFDYVFNKLYYDNDNINEKIQISLTRISFDNALYSKLSLSLKNVLTIIYSYILKHEYKEILLERLNEELTECANICSTGILERMVNSLSGFDENLGLRISFEDQIISNFGGRLNTRIQNLLNQPCLHKSNKIFCTCLQDICDESRDFITLSITDTVLRKCEKCICCVHRDKIKKVKNKLRMDISELECIHNNCDNTTCNEILVNDILEQMIIPPRYFERRITFLKFLRLHLSDIMEELREEFKDYVDPPTFDMCFRRALINYEGEN